MINIRCVTMSMCKLPMVMNVAVFSRYKLIMRMIMMPVSMAVPMLMSDSLMLM